MKLKLTCNFPATVYYCGPNELAKTLKEKTKAASSATVRFSFVKEHFVSSSPAYLHMEGLLT